MRNEVPSTRRRAMTRTTPMGIAAAVLAAALLVPCGRAHAAYISINAGQNATSILGGDFEYGFTSNGHNTNLGRGGAAYTVPNGTTLSFTGKLVDRGGTVASSRQVFVLPYAGANYAVADLSVSNTASSSLNPNSSSYSLSGVFRSNETVLVPANAQTIVAGQSVDFDSLFASNTLSTTPVPEPASLLLLGTGAAAALVTRRRARHLAAPPGRSGRP